MSTIYDAAIEFQKLLGFEYKLVFGYKGNSVEVPLRFYEDKFFHLSGLQYLSDISKIEDAANTTDAFNKIIGKEITHQDLVVGARFKEKNLQDRIDRVADLSRLLNSAIFDKNVTQVYKYNKNANPNSDIIGNFIIKNFAPDKRTEYFILCKNMYDPDKYFGISIFSRDLSNKKQKDFAIGHTQNTLLYVSRTPLTKDKQLDKNKEVVLFRLPSYSVPTNSNINVVKFTSLSRKNGGILVAPHPTLGQALANLINGLAEKIKTGVEERRQELRKVKQENDAFKDAIAERDEQLAEKNDEIANLKKECADLSDQLKKHKQLVTTAAKPTRSFSQNLDDFAKRVRAENTAKPQSKTDQMHKTDKRR